MKSKILDAVPQEQRAHLPLLTRLRNKSVTDLLDREKFIKSYVERGDEIAAYERIALPEGQAEHYFLVEVKLMQSRRSYYLLKGTYQIANSRLFIFDKRKTVRDIKKEIYAFLRPLLPSYKGAGGKRKGTPEEDIEEEYKYYFEGKNSA